MMTSDDRLNMLDDLHDLLHNIDEQIEVTKLIAQRQDIIPNQMQNMQWDLMMAPLYLAKSQVIASIIALQDKE